MGEINFKVNLTYGGGHMQDEEGANQSAFFVQFVFWGIILPLVVAIGLVGNVLTIIVLWRREMQSPTIFYLRGLVITDTGILIMSVIVLTPYSMSNYLTTAPPLIYYKQMVYPVLHTPMNFIIMALQTSNVWITVAVSVERYIAICHPFRAARICTKQKALIVIIVIGVISVGYNIPRLFATHVRDCKEEEKEHGQECFALADTAFGTTYYYKTVYSNIMYCIIIYVIPLAVLFVLNVFILKELMRMQKRRSGSNIHEENEANLSLVLVLIVVVFIFCQTPGLVAQFDIFTLPTFLKWLAVSNTLFVLNSAVNFLIYTAFGRRFRQVLLRVFRKIVKSTRSLSLSPTRAITINGYELTAINDMNDTPSTIETYCPEKV
ncbi:FMRFamide receptor [Patella vulgata]|uniref:FMRFamide receptor n=1 Tax=Patella vulgata TaxID=6465 RepID=UPI00217FB062|nr:FMRFamide receptor [Patella vulgata]XP_050391823.1 FMRFamide receptor [Patella vulgata]XP_050391824.1 FMRFamide receptor [Patella vulgata]XP_050391825.1 FMRFamide receptor [Patella vulgata]XP_050391826.1 FMRFamide receptor [Patella vulgata]XP_050391827.1 FMRFamide receptor [Patella vulgata]XP_050391828.1 FMRFamide receptor [Patella vulgata]XP_050391829.1 FMRFamide receptor [Patella vulgata]XP_050391830.1 FMRFamide receptor [Patella vulgata]XP_055954937.1 FMRFamide receptor [Patella vulg